MTKTIASYTHHRPFEPIPGGTCPCGNDCPADGRRYYVVALDRISSDGSRDRLAALVGPFYEHAGALAVFDRARQLAIELDRRATFYQFHTLSALPECEARGVLNGHLGLAPDPEHAGFVMQGGAP